MPVVDDILRAEIIVGSGQDGHSAFSFRIRIDIGFSGLFFAVSANPLGRNVFSLQRIQNKSSIQVISNGADQMNRMTKLCDPYCLVGAFSSQGISGIMDFQSAARLRQGSDCEENIPMDTSNGDEAFLLQEGRLADTLFMIHGTGNGEGSVRHWCVRFLTQMYQITADSISEFVIGNPDTGKRCVSAELLLAVCQTDERKIGRNLIMMADNQVVEKICGTVIKADSSGKFILD